MRTPQPLPAFLLLSLFALLVGCGSEAPDGAEGESGLSPEDARPLVIRAAAVPTMVMDELSRLGATVRPEDLNTTPLTLALMTVNPSEATSADLGWRKFGAATTPRDLMKGLAEIGEGMTSLLNDTTLKSISCDSEGDLATGTVVFAYEDIVEGKVRFLAKRAEKGWEIVEFSVPASSFRNFRDESGTWQVSLGP